MSRIRPNVKQMIRPKSEMKVWMENRELGSVENLGCHLSFVIEILLKLIMFLLTPRMIPSYCCQ